jgi:putative DNA primase/helicase
MDPLDTFLAAVPDGGRKVGGQHLMRCPVHPDKRPSLAVRELADGKLLVHCHAGCTTADVLDALGLRWRDLRP